MDSVCFHVSTTTQFSVCVHVPVLAMYFYQGLSYRHDPGDPGGLGSCTTGAGSRFSEHN